MLDNPLRTQLCDLTAQTIRIGRELAAALRGIETGDPDHETVHGRIITALQARDPFSGLEQADLDDIGAYLDQELARETMGTEIRYGSAYGIGDETFWYDPHSVARRTTRGDQVRIAQRCLGALSDARDRALDLAAAYRELAPV